MNEDKKKQTGNTEIQQKTAEETKEENNKTTAERFANPISNYNITSKFGNRVDPILKREFIDKFGEQAFVKLKTTDKEYIKMLKFHNGIDLTGNKNIKAAHGGTVTRLNEDVSNLAGKYIEISFTIGNDVFNTIYCHLSEIKVKIKQDINQNDVIGIMGSTGKSTGTHLHYIIKKNAKYENPINYLKAE